MANYVSPVTGTIARKRSSPFKAARKGGRLHSGVDYQAKNGSTAVAVIGGTVKGIGDNPGGYDEFAFVAGDDGHAYRYATHGKIIPKTGDRVEQGDPIGLIGRSHLHFEIIPPSSPAYQKIIDGQVGVNTQTWPGKPEPTIDPLAFFGVKGGDVVTAGQAHGTGAAQATSTPPVPTQSPFPGPSAPLQTTDAIDAINSTPWSQEIQEALSGLSDLGTQAATPPASATPPATQEPGAWEQHQQMLNQHYGPGNVGSGLSTANPSPFFQAQTRAQQRLPGEAPPEIVPTYPGQSRVDAIVANDLAKGKANLIRDLAKGRPGVPEQTANVDIGSLSQMPGMEPSRPPSQGAPPAGVTIPRYTPPGAAAPPPGAIPLPRLNPADEATSIEDVIAQAVNPGAAVAPAPDLGSRIMVRESSPVARDDVMALQTVLRNAGFDLGPTGVDGEFGPATERAVKAFQGANALPPDGVVGTKTRAALQEFNAPSQRSPVDVGDRAERWSTPPQQNNPDTFQLSSQLGTDPYSREQTAADRRSIFDVRFPDEPHPSIPGRPDLAAMRDPTGKPTIPEVTAGPPAKWEVDTSGLMSGPKLFGKNSLYNFAKGHEDYFSSPEYAQAQAAFDKAFAKERADLAAAAEARRRALPPTPFTKRQYPGLADRLERTGVDLQGKPYAADVDVVTGDVPRELTHAEMIDQAFMDSDYNMTAPSPPPQGLSTARLRPDGTPISQEEWSRAVMASELSGQRPTPSILADIGSIFPDPRDYTDGQQYPGERALMALPGIIGNYIDRARAGLSMSSDAAIPPPGDTTNLPVTHPDRVEPEGTWDWLSNIGDFVTGKSGYDLGGGGLYNLEDGPPATDPQKPPEAWIGIRGDAGSIIDELFGVSSAHAGVPSVGTGTRPPLPPEALPFSPVERAPLPSAIENTDGGIYGANAQALRDKLARNIERSNQEQSPPPAVDVGGRGERWATPPASRYGLGSAGASAPATTRQVKAAQSALDDIEMKYDPPSSVKSAQMAHDALPSGFGGKPRTAGSSRSPRPAFGSEPGVSVISNAKAASYSPNYEGPSGRTVAGDYRTILSKDKVKEYTPDFSDIPGATPMDKAYHLSMMPTLAPPAIGAPLGVNPQRGAFRGATTLMGGAPKISFTSGGLIGPNTGKATYGVKGADGKVRGTTSSGSGYETSTSTNGSGRTVRTSNITKSDGSTRTIKTYEGSGRGSARSRAKARRASGNTLGRR